METVELLKKVRKVEIKSRGLSNQIFAGEYHSAFKGRGMAFSEVREYQAGDDIRAIDWNVTARFNHPYVKVFEEEREMTVMLIVDVSASREFGTQKQLKQDLVTELCATLAFSAIQNNDKIGIVFFSDKIERFIPPKKGRGHILRIIRELIDFKAESKTTNIKLALQYFTTIIKKRSTVFLISDFIENKTMSPFSFEDTLKITNRKHDLVALKIIDKRELDIPSIGLVNFIDAESGVVKWIDTSDSEVRKNYHLEATIKAQQLANVFIKNGIDFTTINTDEPYTKPLINLFKKRER